MKVRWQLPKWAVHKWKCESESPWGEGFAFLVTQWEIICLPIQETRVSLVQEDPTCLGAIKPMSHKYWPCALESCSLNYWARVPHLLKPASSRTCAPQEKPLQFEAHKLCSHGFFFFFLVPAHGEKELIFLPLLVRALILLKGPHPQDLIYT